MEDSVWMRSSSQSFKVYTEARVLYCSKAKSYQKKSSGKMSSAVGNSLYTPNSQEENFNIRTLRYSFSLPVWVPLKFVWRVRLSEVLSVPEEPWAMEAEVISPAQLCASLSQILIYPDFNPLFPLSVHSFFPLYVCLSVLLRRYLT